MIRLLCFGLAPAPANGAKAGGVFLVFQPALKFAPGIRPDFGNLNFDSRPNNRPDERLFGSGDMSVEPGGGVCGKPDIVQSVMIFFREVQDVNGHDSP